MNGTDEDPPGWSAVTVVIPARNASVTIAAQLQALVSQINAPAFEVVVVADTCTDDTVQVVDGWSQLAS